jgi:hypothetical protein
MSAVLVGNIEKVGPDYIWWRNGTDKRQINFADNWMQTKEEWAAGFHSFMGKPVAIPVDGPFFIAVDFLPGDFEGPVKVVQLPFPIASVERL